MKNALSFDPGVVLKTGVTLGAYTPTPTLPAEVAPGSSRARGDLLLSALLRP